MLELPETAPAAGSSRDRDDAFYDLLAGGARTRVLEAFLDLQVPELLANEGPMTAAAICERLALQPHRGWKFLHLASLVGLLEQEGGLHGEDDAVFSLSEHSREWFGEDGKQGYFFRDLINYWRQVAYLPMVDVLRGMPLPYAVQWPPIGLAEAEHLETWMRITADGAIKSLIDSGALKGARSLLDVGGGDGTVASSLVEQLPELAVTVFNLPASAYIARRTTTERGTTDRVKIYEGDFLKDEFPEGFDRLSFNRVLADWTPEVCSLLFEKAHRALKPDGRLIINEPVMDGNMGLSIAWEFRYVFYDTFGRACYKKADTYRQLLEEKNFEVVNVYDVPDEIYTVIEAKPG